MTSHFNLLMVTATKELTEDLIRLGYEGLGVVHTIDFIEGVERFELRPVTAPDINAYPTLESVNEWLREERGIFINIVPTAEWCYGDTFSDNYEFELRYKMGGSRYASDGKVHEGYNNTLLRAIKKAVGILKQVKQRANR